MDEQAPRARRLVRDLMSVGVPTCPLTTPVIEIARLFLDKQLEAVVVLDDYGHAAGFVSQDELIKAYTRSDYETLTAEAILRDGLVQVPPDIPLTAAAQIMQDHGARVLYMTHHAGGIEYPAAMLTYNNLLRHMARQENDNLNDLGVRADRETPLETFYRRRDEARRRAGYKPGERS